MVAVHDYALFVFTAILLNVTPGPDTLFILGRSLSNGRNAGIASALGISTGCLFHTFAAAFGLSAVLATSTLAFSVVKYGGAAYLIYMGVKTLGAKGPAVVDAAADKGVSTWTVFKQGALTNVLNPKVALFFLALLPQFVDAGAAHPVPAFFALGLTFIATGTVWCLLVALLAARFSTWLRRSETASRVMNRVSGAVFLGLGVKLAVAER
jgi:RhtB (resistance to homoserine/threonine) family protein